MGRHLALVLLVSSLVCGATALAEERGERTSVFRVEGMTCALCAKALEKALGALEGVRSVEIDREAEQVAIVAESRLAPGRLEEAIEGAGPYRAELVP